MKNQIILGSVRALDECMKEIKRTEKTILIVILSMAILVGIIITV